MGVNNNETIQHYTLGREGVSNCTTTVYTTTGPELCLEKLIVFTCLPTLSTPPSHSGLQSPRDPGRRMQGGEWPTNANE